jgi:hypothetical protein
MAPANGIVGHSSPLTPEECKFIVEVLHSVKLQGNTAALRQALELIDGITGKLEEELEEADKTRMRHLLP